MILRYIKAVLKGHSNNVRIGLLANILPGSTFEGNNYIGRFTTFRGSIGKYSYIGTGGVFLGKIGRYTSIAAGVHVINGRHPIKIPFVATHPVFYSIQTPVGSGFVDKQIFEEYVFAEDDNPVVIGNDCWIGSNVSIIEGVKIEDGAVALAGAVVTKNVPPYAIVGGVPATIIGYRYDDDKIAKLCNIKWWNKDEQWLKDNIQLFSNIDDFLKKNK